MSFSAGQNLNLAFAQSLVFRHTVRDGEIIEAILPKNLAFLRRETEVFEPNNIPGSCTITSHRAVMRRLSDSRFTTDWLASASLYNNKTMVTEGLIFSVFNETSGLPLNIRVPKNANDNCVMNNCTSFSRSWLPASTFNTSVSVPLPTNKFERHSPDVPSYSMFARFNFDELPKAKYVLEQLKEGVEDVENVRNDLSPSNLAILCLPLLMAIPPLSLLEPASDATIAWYAFATDILAAIPLMIKGIEMVLFYRKATPKMISTLSLAGEKFQIFEMWYIRCKPPIGRVGQDGVTIVAITFWIMVASTYVEFLFWREKRHRQGLLKKFEDDIERLPDAETMNTTADDTDGILKRILHSCFRGRRKYFALFSVILTIELFIVICEWVSPDKIYILNTLTAITLVVFRAVLVKRFRQFMQWRFWVGVVLGFLTGPVYLLIHAFEGIRKSDRWEVIAEGCNFGFGFLALTLHILIVPRGAMDKRWYSQATDAFVFPWVYGISVILIHAIRSEASDREVWRFGCHAFALGMLFGPLGLLFKRCFPECMERKRARHNFFGGLIYGTIFGTSVIAFAANALRQVD